ncbi:hypothetical protein ABT269_26955 [Streptomyces viridosporus]|uniref:hypothetical protein n=1 Tax=Streptomyces viridosporus TaxID=67581 RepID=UPI003323CEE8
MGFDGGVGDACGGAEDVRIGPGCGFDIWLGFGHGFGCPLLDGLRLGVGGGSLQGRLHLLRRGRRLPQPAVQLVDGAADGDELTADVGEVSGGGVVGAGEGVAGDGPDLGEAAGDGVGGVLPGLVDGVLLVGDLLLDGGEVSGEVDELLKRCPVNDLRHAG